MVLPSSADFYVMIKFTSCSNITFIDGYVNIFINKSKTDQYRQGNENPISAGITSDCPVKMLQRYISLGNINTFLVIVLLKSVFKSKEGLKLTKTKKTKHRFTRARECMLSKLKSIIGIVNIYKFAFLVIRKRDISSKFKCERVMFEEIRKIGIRFV